MYSMDEKPVSDLTNMPPLPTSQTAASMPQSSTPSQVPGQKKAPVLLIVLGIILGVAILCCGVSVGGYFLVTNAIQNSAEAKTVKNFYNALNTGDKTTVKSLSTTQLYTDLYYQYADGSLADYLKNNITDVKIISFSTEENNSTVIYLLTVKQHADILGKFTRADLTRDSATSPWTVSYIGPAVPTGSLTPTPTTE